MSNRRIRNETRKPAIYLLVVLPIMVGGGVSLLIALLEAYSRVTGLARSAVPNQNGLLIMLPAFFLWIPASLLISNVVLHGIAPMRRIAEAYVVQAACPGFADSQKALLRLLAWFALVCVPLIFLGFVI